MARKKTLKLVKPVKKSSLLYPLLSMLVAFASGALVAAYVTHSYDMEYMHAALVKQAEECKVNVCTFEQSSSSQGD